jgi:hypothetical protein
VQVLTLRGKLSVVSMYTHTPTGGCAAVEWVQAVARPLQVSYRDRCFLNSKQVLPAHWGCRLGCLYHCIEGATAMEAAPCWWLCSWGTPALVRIRGHKQGTAAVSRVFKVCQGGLRRRQRLLQVSGQCNVNASVPWDWRAGLCRLKCIVICKRQKCQRQVRAWNEGMRLGRLGTSLPQYSYHCWVVRRSWGDLWTSESRGRAFPTWALLCPLLPLVGCLMAGIWYMQGVGHRVNKVDIASSCLMEDKMQ